MLKKLDWKKDLKYLYDAPKDKVSEVDVPPMNYLMVNGKGDPNTSQEYREAVEALFSTAYAVKFALKKSGGADYSVMPLEGLWWPDGNTPFVPGNKQGKTGTDGHLSDFCAGGTNGMSRFLSGTSRNSSS